MTTCMEHRWGHRVDADLPVMIGYDGRMSGMGRVSNVSLSGALLVTALNVPLHASVTVSPLRDGKATADLSACVVRTDAGTVAVEWRDMASPQVIALIKSVSSDATALERRDPYAA
jgi:hypothetical protein